MKDFELIAFAAFSKLHDLSAYTPEESVEYFHEVCRDYADMDIYIQGWKDALEHGLLREVKDAITFGFPIREALKEWDLLRD